MAAIESAGLQVVAVSYDPVETLAGYSEDRGVTFPLLSDGGSATIRAYGLEDEDNGFPHPGTIIVTPDRKVAARFFRKGYRRRHEPTELIEWARANLR